MLIIPVSATPNQSFLVALNTQNCTINLYQKSTGLFLDLYVTGNTIVTGAICLDRTLIVRDVYHGFNGDICFFDVQGTDDPSSSKLGTRWLLAYLLPADLIRQ